jgi:hypothetical protein
VHFLPTSTPKKIAVLFYCAGAASEAVRGGTFGSSSYAAVQPRTSTMIRAKFSLAQCGGMQRTIPSVAPESCLARHPAAAQNNVQEIAQYPALAQPLRRGSLLSFVLLKHGGGSLRRPPSLVCMPQCTRPCRVLFGNGRFLCRYCWGVGYRLQREPRSSRTISRMHKLRARLGGSASLLELFPAPSYASTLRSLLRLAASALSLRKGREWAY